MTQPRKKMPERMRRAYLRRKGRTPSKTERAELWKMNLAMYGNRKPKEDSQTPIDRESNVKDIADVIERKIQMADEKNPVPASEAFIAFTMPNGEQVTIDPGVPKSFKDTKAYAEDQLWPDMPQLDQNALFGMNVCLLDWRRMTKGKPGMPPYFAVLAATEKHGTFTFLSSGETVNRKLSKLFGMDSVKGEPNGYKDETKDENGNIRGVWVSFHEREGGNYERYFDIGEPIEIT